MLPDGVHFTPAVSSPCGEVGVQVAVEVGFEDQVTRFQVFLARGSADEDHVVHHHQARQVSAGDFGERAAVVARELAR